MNKEDFYHLDGSPWHGIFREIPLSGQWHKEEKFPLYTTRQDDDDLPSAHKIYMAALNEFDAATQLTPSWEYWKGMIKTCVKIRRVIEVWREEKYQRDQMRARALLWKAAETGNVTAQRILYEAKKEERQQRLIERKEYDQVSQDAEMLQERLARLTELKAVRK